jgi:hypothetical protein
MGGVISPVSVILMEVFWVYPWLVWSGKVPLFDWNRVPLNFLSCLFLIVVPYLVTRFIPARRRLMWWVKLGLVILNILLVFDIEYGGGQIPLSGEWFRYSIQLLIDSFTTFHPAIPALGVSVYLSWRGIRLGNTPSFFDDVYRSFLFGLVAVILLIIVWTASLGTVSAGNMASSTGLYIAGFFFFGLTSLAMGNFLNIRERLRRYQSVPLSNRKWFIILVTAIGVMVVIATAIASIFSSDIAGGISGFFGKMFNYLNYPLQYIYIPLSYIIEVIWYIMTFFINLVRSKTTMAEFEFPGLDQIEGLEENAVPTGGFDFMIIMKWITLLLVIWGALYILYKVGKRFQSRISDSGVEEFSESLWSWLGFKTDLRMFFSRLFDRWFGSRIKSIRAGLSSIGRSETNYPDNMDIREIYRHMMKETSVAGHKHQSYETPFEYAGRLDKSLPGIEKQVDDITSLYVPVRYGDSGLKDWESEHANVMFRLLRRILHRPDKETKN